MNLGLEELYRRHLPLHDDETVGYYDTGLGYSNPERSAEAEQESFAICLATTDDEVFYAGDHDRPLTTRADQHLRREPICGWSRTDNGMVKPLRPRNVATRYLSLHLRVSRGCDS